MKYARALLFVAFARHLPPSSARYGRVFTAIRRAILRPLMAPGSGHFNVDHGARLGLGRSVRIGDRSAVGIDAQVIGPATIGNDVMMAPEVLILALNHETGNPEVPMIEQGHRPPEPVTIEDDVWIGQRAIILPGVTIGRGSIVGAGAVVAKSVPPYSVVVGNPGRVVRSRLTQSVEG